MTRSPLVSARRVAAAALVLAAAACGRGPNQSADRNGADTTSADRTSNGPLGNPVGENKPANDSAYARGQQRLDSLRAAGVRPDNGIDSTTSKVQAQTANEPVHDTSHLNNRATPEGVSPRGRRP